MQFAIGFSAAATACKGRARLGLAEVHAGAAGRSDTRVLPGTVGHARLQVSCLKTGLTFPTFGSKPSIGYSKLSTVQQAANHAAAAESATEAARAFICAEISALASEFDFNLKAILLTGSTARREQTCLLENDILRLL